MREEAAMADKGVEACDVELDELGLSLLGW
jgi:hypothetical protein